MARSQDESTTSAKRVALSRSGEELESKQNRQPHAKLLTIDEELNCEND